MTDTGVAEVEFFSPLERQRAAAAAQLDGVMRGAQDSERVMSLRARAAKARSDEERAHFLQQAEAAQAEDLMYGSSE